MPTSAFWRENLNDAILLFMEQRQHIWETWAGILQRWGWSGWVAAFLESAGSLTALIAQLLYLGQPLAGFFFPENQLQSLAEMLEQPLQRSSFIDLLRKEDQASI